MGERSYSITQITPNHSTQCSPENQQAGANQMDCPLTRYDREEPSIHVSSTQGQRRHLKNSHSVRMASLRIRQPQPERVPMLLSIRHVFRTFISIDLCHQHTILFRLQPSFVVAVILLHHTCLNVITMNVFSAQKWID